MLILDTTCANWDPRGADGREKFSKKEKEQIIGASLPPYHEDVDSQISILFEVGATSINKCTRASCSQGHCYLRVAQFVDLECVYHMFLSLSRRCIYDAVRFDKRMESMRSLYKCVFRSRSISFLSASASLVKILDIFFTHTYV